MLVCRDLSSNHISSLASGVFDELRSLQTLYDSLEDVDNVDHRVNFRELSANQISLVPANAFAFLTQLRTLYG